MCVHTTDMICTTIIKIAQIIRKWATTFAHRNVKILRPSNKLDAVVAWQMDDGMVKNIVVCLEWISEFISAWIWDSATACRARDKKRFLDADNMIITSTDNLSISRNRKIIFRLCFALASHLFPSMYILSLLSYHCSVLSASSLSRIWKLLRKSVFSAASLFQLCSCHRMSSDFVYCWLFILFKTNWIPPLCCAWTINFNHFTLVFL